MARASSSRLEWTSNALSRLADSGSKDSEFEAFQADSHSSQGEIFMKLPSSALATTSPSSTILKGWLFYIPLLFAVVVCSWTVALGQSANVAGTPYTGHTPPAVVDGSAKLVQHYNSSQMLRLTLGLQPPHMAEEKQFLQDLQTKGSPDFHHFLSPEEWTKRFDPSEQDEQAVVDWAKAQRLNVTHRFPNRLLVDVEGPVSAIEKAFNVTINLYQLDTMSGYSNDRDPEIPSTLTGVIQSVGGLNNLQVLHPANKSAQEPMFPDYAPGPVVASGLAEGRNGNRSKLPKAQSKKRGLAPPITGGAYDPSDMYSSQAYDTNALYNQGHCCNPLGNPGVTPPETSIAIATAGSQQGSDIVGFQAQYPYLAYHYQEFYIDGTPTCCDGEGTMDMEWSTAMSNSFGSYVDTAMVYLYDGVNANFSTFNDIYNHILTDGHARVFTTSWGCRELACYDSGDMNTANSIFSSMVGQGWTLMAASGDQGASAGCSNATAIQFPSSDPNVVAAGGTTLSLSSGPFYNYEVAWSGGPAGCGSNDGGSTGGYSAYYSTPFYQSSLGLPSRGVPDVALNADWYNTPQNFYFGGALSGNGGTSIVAPELAGFFANENAYLLYLSSVISGGLCNGHACAPLGNGNWYLYYFGEHPGYAPHYPFYDITSGCNNNDVTSFYGLTYYCAGSGWDPVTGWGSVNMFQLAWAINTYSAGDFGAPAVTFSGPATNVWYNSDVLVSWGITDTSNDGLPPVGVAGFSQAWDFDPGDNSREPTPGSGSSFYSGPQYPNATSGCLDFTGASCAGGGLGQGWHYVNVRPWDNTGVTTDYVYGPLGYDTIPPTTTDSLSGTFNGSVFTTPVKVTLSATDPSPGSGVAGTIYQLGANPPQNYVGPFTIASTGFHSLNFHSTDHAGNVESNHVVQVHIEAPTTTTLTSSKNPSSFHQAVTFTAKVAGTFGATPIGFVTFKNGGVAMGGAVPLSGGTATFTSSALGTGSHSITASYGGNGANLASASATLTQTVNKASTTTTITSSINPSSFHQSVTFTATVHRAFGGAATGTVTFKNGSTVIGTGAVNSSGIATLSTNVLTVGIHSITASYGGDGNFLTSASSPLAQTVNKANTTITLSSSLNPSHHGNAVTFTAKVLGTFGGSPLGTVTFKDGTTVLGTGSVNATTHLATFTTSALTVGTHPIKSIYQGSGSFNSSVSAILSQVVNP